MKDRKGTELSVGDRVYVLPAKEGIAKEGIASGPGYVRRFSQDGTECRVDDGPAGVVDLATSTSWSWAAWVGSDGLEKL
jgi:hypothetical protein